MQRRKRATQILENELSNNEEENVEEENKSDNENELNKNSQKAIIDNHRDKSREIAQRIGEDNPNEVIDELHLVRDKIKDKIKQSLTDKLEKAREHDETASSEKIEQTKDKKSCTQNEHQGNRRVALSARRDSRKTRKPGETVLLPEQNHHAAQ
jgi:hypothetical protein